LGSTLLIAKKEMSSLLKEKTLVLAIIVQLLIASFSSLLVIGLASFFDPSALGGYDERVNVGFVGSGELSRFIEKSNVRPYYYKDTTAALADFNDNKIDAVLVTPLQVAESTEIINIEIYLPKSEIKSTLVTLQLKRPLEEYEAFVRDIRSSRIGFEPFRLYVDAIPEKTSTYFEFIYGILIPLLVFTPVFISGGLIIDMLTEEFERRTMELLLVSPLSFFEILSGKMLAAVVIVPVQVFLWLALVMLNGIEVYGIGAILLVISIIAVIIVLVGAAVAVRYKERAISQYIYSQILIFLFLMGYLFSDSPFNLVTRLSSGSAGFEALANVFAYAVLALPLYVYIKKIKLS